MSYYFFMDDLLLPIAPESVSLKIMNRNETISLINEGEASIIKSPGLSEISFDARLPNRKYSFASYDMEAGGLLANMDMSMFRKADYYLEKFSKFKTERKPLRLIIIRIVADGAVLHTTNMQVTLEEYSIEESVSEGVDVVCPLQFRQYRKFTTKECDITDNGDGTKTLKVKETRESEDKGIPKAVRVAGQMSVLEAVKMATNGNGDWRNIAMGAGVPFPSVIPAKGTVLNLG